MTRSRRAVFAGVLGAALTACSSGAPDGVSMEGHAFEPSEITVESGTTLVWTNEGDEPHTVTAYGGALPDGGAYFASGGASSEDEARDEVADALVAPGETYEVTFDVPGTYEYFCIPHEADGMKGKVTVE